MNRARPSRRLPRFVIASVVIQLGALTTRSAAPEYPAAPQLNTSKLHKVG